MKKLFLLIPALIIIYILLWHNVFPNYIHGPQTESYEIGNNTEAHENVYKVIRITGSGSFQSKEIEKYDRSKKAIREAYRIAESYDDTIYINYSGTKYAEVYPSGKYRLFERRGSGATETASAAWSVSAKVERKTPYGYLTMKSSWNTYFFDLIPLPASVNNVKVSGYHKWFFRSMLGLFGLLVVISILRKR